jgi:hypothetical protein
MSQQLSIVAARLREFIRRHSPAAPPADRLAPEESERAFETLALDLFAAQFATNAPYRAWCERRGTTPASVASWREIPAVPTDAFKEADMTSIPAVERMAEFRSSGTTAVRPGRHFHHAESLAVYEASLKPWFEACVLSDLDDLVEEQLIGPLDRLGLLALTPAPEVVPQSSLVHMFGVIARDFGSRDSLFAGCLSADGSWEIDFERVLFALRKSMCANRPLILAGTAFNFVHLLDHFAADNRRYRLAHGSRVIETGGYKGRARSMPREELHAGIARHLGIARERIVTEYGMSELSSQAYDVPCEDGRRQLQFPPWARVRIVSPETGEELPEGQPGMIQICDLANVWSVMALLTGDIGVRDGNGFSLVGRAALAEPRGCSLMSR